MSCGCVETSASSSPRLRLRSHSRSLSLSACKTQATIVQCAQDLLAACRGGAVRTAFCCGVLDTFASFFTFALARLALALAASCGQGRYAQFQCTIATASAAVAGEGCGHEPCCWPRQPLEVPSRNYRLRSRCRCRRRRPWAAAVVPGAAAPSDVRPLRGRHWQQFAAHFFWLVLVWFALAAILDMFFFQ